MSRWLGRRTAPVAAVAVVVLAVLAGCSEDQAVAVEATPEFLAASAERTVADDTGRFEQRMQQRIELEGQGEQIQEIQSEGVFDAAADQVAMDLSTSVTSDGFGDVSGEGEAVQDGTEVFYRGFPFTETPAGPVPGVDADAWVSVELPDELLELNVPDLEQTGAVPSPAQELDRLLSSVEDVTEEGDAEVQGVETTHLSATYVLPEEAVEVIDDLQQGLEVEREQPVDVWVDDEGIVRRIEGGSQVSGPGLDVQTSVVTEYFDLGEPVEIEVPEDAVPLEDLVAEQTGLDPAAELDETFAEPLDEALGGDPEQILEGLPPEMQEIARAMSELSLEQLSEDPCQVVEDPELHQQCETYLGPGAFGG